MSHPTAENPVDVWVRSLGTGWRVHVRSSDDAMWLLDRLNRSRVLLGPDGVDMQSSATGVDLRIPNSAGRTLGSLETALAHIPGVRLMLQPEAR